MPNRLPPEYFREGSGEESPEPGAEIPLSPEQAQAPGLARRRFREGVAPKLVIAGVLGALLLGFAIGRLMLLEPGQQPPTPSSEISGTSGSPSPSPTMTTLVPYDGPVRTIQVIEASGQCIGQPTNDGAANLIDSNPDTFWRCLGSGTGEQIQFTLAPGEPVVGVRLVNGNTVCVGNGATCPPDRYLTERRILTIRWTFEDGSWVIQGLSANDRQPQEVRFPPVSATGVVTMTVVATTVPGGTRQEDDAVSISSLDFLTVA